MAWSIAYCGVTVERADAFVLAAMEHKMAGQSRSSL